MDFGHNKPQYSHFRRVSFARSVKSIFFGVAWVLDLAEARVRVWTLWTSDTVLVVFFHFTWHNKKYDNDDDDDDDDYVITDGEGGWRSRLQQ